MDRLLRLSCILLCCPMLLHAKASEYQLESDGMSRCETLRGAGGQQGHTPHCTADGQFRSVQCSQQKQECWCVDAQGQEVVGTRTSGSALHCPTPCQLQSVLQCSPSGRFQQIQCESSQGQCWCVDQDGMELYGTRQNGRPAHCPGSCEVRTRRLLHDARPSSPPQCTDDGHFLPVQCKFINVTDRTELDLLHSFNRFPEAFETFTSFRRFFPMVSSYCFCSDSRGREMENTGLELLLSEVYDSAFSGLGSGRLFSQSNIYRVLQRRLLGVRLAVTGHFRCPSACEEERRASLESSSGVTPSCERSGSFSSKQCRPDGLCWCVDSLGRELPGTRQFGDSLVCSDDTPDCLSKRRLALSRLFSGPVDPPVSTSTSRSPVLCRSLLRPLSLLLPVETDPMSFLSDLVEVLHGLFPSVAGALQALAHSSPRRFQENLFGGKFLKSAAAFNFTGALGARGSLGLVGLSSPDMSSRLRTHQSLVQSVSQALEDPNFLSNLQHTLTEKVSSESVSLEQVLTRLLRSCPASEEDASTIFVPRCTASGDFQELQCHSGECWCVDPRGREVMGSRTSGVRPQCPTRCQRERAAALKVRDNLAAGAEIYVPACSPSGSFMPLQCVGARCFCVDAKGKTASTPSTGGAISCPETEVRDPLSSAGGGCLQALAEVDAFRQEVKSMVALSGSAHFPLGYGFLLADGLRLTSKELQVNQSEEELALTDPLLSRSRAALRLAATSTVQMFQSPRQLGYQPYSPQCNANGAWSNTQCYHSTGQCWCVDEDGEYIPNSLSSRPLHLPRCLSLCQRALSHSLLSGWMRASDITASVSSYHPQCEMDGRFSLLQTSGSSGWCVNPTTGETLRTATRGSDGRLTCPSLCELQAAQCQPDGSFVPLQCDVTSCWCVSEDGQEVGNTRTPKLTGQTPSCDRPVCDGVTVTHGALLCQPTFNGRQRCELICCHGYQNSLPNSSFTCETERQRWNLRPLPGACQRSQPLQEVSTSQIWTLPSLCSQISALPSQLLQAMTSRGLCSAQLPSSGRWVSVCDDSSVSVRCDRDSQIRLTLRWTTALLELPISDLPDLHDVGLFLNQSRLQTQVLSLLRSLQFQPTLVSVASPSFGCSRGFRLSRDGEGCVVCPAGSYSIQGACLLCPPGTYQDSEGRDFCNICPHGSSDAGAFSINQCVTECQRRGLRCSERGDFLPAQPDFLSNRWSCFGSEGVELVWTQSEAPLTDDQCSVLSRFQNVPSSQLLLGVLEADVLLTLTADLQSCIQACAEQPSCHYVALLAGQCELYRVNTHCNMSQQVPGFLGNDQAERFDWLSCWLRVRGGASGQLVLRKRGTETMATGFKSENMMVWVRTRMTKVLSGVFRTQVFSSRGASLSDVLRVCQDGCSRDACCNGVILNSNGLSGGSHLCGWLSAPAVLTCGAEDWDLRGQGSAGRVCGAGLTYNKQQRSFVFNFGGQEFSITDADLPADSKNKTNYQSSIIHSQTVYLSTGGASPTPCPAATEPQPPLDRAVLQKFQSLSEEDVQVDPRRRLASLSHWLNKKQYDSQQALLWCLTRKKPFCPSCYPGHTTGRWCASGCEEEQHCSVADLRDAEVTGFFDCVLLPDTQVCGAYDKPLRQPCRPLLDRRPVNTYRKKVDLSGPVESFYQRVSFQKMASYSVRSRVALGENAPLRDSFRECERRCDEDPCCRGIGFVQDTKAPGGASLVCLSLISLGVQTCSEEDQSSWRTQDCSTSAVKTTPEPFGWYQKPVNQWTSSPALCPPFTLPSPKNNVSLDQWQLLADSALLVDPSLPTYDTVHISQDVAVDQDLARDWCLHACQESESCMAVSLQEVESATRCVFYPDTTTCGLSSAPDATQPASSCRLVVREPTSRLYLRTDRSTQLTSVDLPGLGTLQGVAVETPLGSARKQVVEFLGVPYARPPTGALRFQEAQPEEWTGTWDATKQRSSCVQPGDEELTGSSEDCLYLNVFTPASRRGRVPVLVFFYNPSTDQDMGRPDGAMLAASGDIVVVTASYRTAALGFLSTGSSGLPGNYGLTDQQMVLRWVHAHIALVGGDNMRVTVGAERQGADITSVHLLSSSSSPPLFQRMILMGGSVFSPSLFQTPATSKLQTLDLAKELGCMTADSDQMVACLRAAPVQQLNAAQTKLLAVSGPFRSWAPVLPPSSPSAFQRVDLLLGTSQRDGLIGRARRIKDFEALRGRADGKTAFYEALSRSLGGAKESQLLKDAAAWFYSLDHSTSPAGYSLFSRALNNATRDLFIVCPSHRMASHWAKSRANVFLYHLPATEAHDRSGVLVPLDVQLMFGSPHHPNNSQRFSSADRRLSLAMMSYVSSFVRTGNPNPSSQWPESVLPRWSAVSSTDAAPAYLQLSLPLTQQQGLSQNSCSFWSQLGARLTRTGVSGQTTTPSPLNGTDVLPTNSSGNFSTAAPNINVTGITNTTGTVPTVTVNPNINVTGITNTTGTVPTVTVNPNITANVTSMAPPVPTTPNSTIPVATSTKPSTGGNGGDVPGWGIALLVLAAVAVLLLLLLLTGLLVWWCRHKKQKQHFSPYGNMTYKNDIPLYTTHSNLTRNGSAHVCGRHHDDQQRFKDDY
ncbi:thyroglobulin [Synchiropus splendidus]|uniref:thyroglobulin n=1 Tax=Synchiropus splendidus TaxID=270530 RepID=UPI00237EBCBA|nr:thyroglobulin [Synchiropus splendidus]